MNLIRCRKDAAAWKTPHDATLAKLVAGYSSSRVIRQALGAATAFLRPKLLSPEHFGLWTLLRLIPNYAAYLHFGSRTAMRYLIPYHQVDGDGETVRRMQETVFTGSLAATAGVALGLVLWGLLPGSETALRIGLFAMAVIILLQFLGEFVISNLKSDQDFALLSRLNLFVAVGSFVVSLPLLLFFEYYGLLLSLLLTNLLGVVFLLGRRRIFFPLRFDPAMFWRLIRQGMPPMLSELFITLITTADRFVIGFFLGKEALGHYGVGIMLFSLFVNIPGAAREVLEPMVMREIKKSPPQRIVRRYLVVPVAQTVRLSPPLVVAGYFSLPPVFVLFLPRYLPGLTAARILLLGVYFLSLSYPARTLITAYNLQQRFTLWLLPVLLATPLLSAMLVRSPLGLAGAALANVIALACIPLLQFLLLSRQMEHSMRPVLWVSLVISPGVLILLTLPSAVLLVQERPVVNACLAVSGGLAAYAVQGRQAAWLRRVCGSGTAGAGHG